MKRPRYILPIIIISQFAGTSLWFAGNAVLPELQLAFGLDKHAVSSITTSVQLGFIAGTLVFALLSIADRFSPSSVFFFSSLIAAAANVSVIFSAETSVVIALRFVTGFFLAGIYPVGMKIAADWYDKQLGKALGYLVGALVIGTAFPHLLKDDFSLPWKKVMMVTSAFAAVGGLLVFVLISDGPFRKRAARFHPTALLIAFRSPAFRSAALGYFGHMWELYSFWAFVPLIIYWHNAVAEPQISIPLMSFIAIAAGAVGCVIGGWLSKTIGSARVAFFALAVSCTCCLISPFMFNCGNLIFICFLIIWGLSAAADSPQFSALVAATAPAENKGSALTIVICIGFAITIVSIFFIDQLQHWATFPKYIFSFLSIGPILGLISMIPLVRKRGT